MVEPRIEYNFTAEDLVKANRTTSYNIDALREWLNLMPTIPHLSDEQIAIFLIACKNDIEATKNCIVCFFKYKAAAPELFAERDLDGDEMINSFKVSSVAIMPQRTKENYSVVIGSLKDTSYSSFNLDSQCKVVFMYLDYILHENPPAGLIVVLNLKGVGLMHITRLKLSTVKKFFAFLQEALPTQLKHIHILNTSYVFDKILVILKPFMNRELFDMIITHSPNADMEAFFKNHIGKDTFPSDFGGTLPNLEQLCQETKYKCKKVRSYLEACENQVQAYKENRR
ncbi:retinaldehyde-binding protein 1-like [Euwallacea fornicatus]|uniref:retinaldehyde-binding protein 1-like n=1 Tax=Euwallacea fornicatus TaxID=995702 RepID=UPI00338E0C9A